MKILQLSLAIAVMASLCGTAQAYTMTFDDVPAGDNFAMYYSSAYGINLEWPNVSVQDNTASLWGPPHSGVNVLITSPNFSNSRLTIMFKWGDFAHLDDNPLYVSSLGAFFSTEQDTVLQMVGYTDSFAHPVASVYIGAVGESWRNRYMEISSSAGNINLVAFYPVSTDAFHSFCLDDLTVTPVPEPSSFAALGAGILPIGTLLLRKRQRGRTS